MSILDNSSVLITGGTGSLGKSLIRFLLNDTKVRRIAIFSRDELNLKMVLPVTFSEATLGADVKVPTLDGDEVTVRIAPGTANGRVLRVKGRGIETTKGRGDLLITIDVQVPQRVDGAAKKALEDFAKATAEFDPREDLAQKARA